MNYLWIDLWDKLCGLAYTLEWVIFTLPAVKRVEIIKRLQQLIEEKNISVLVVWLPYDLYGIDTRQLDKTQKFIEKLKNIFPHLEVLWEDERFTTFEAYNILESGPTQKKNFKEQKDSLSAFLILESYMNKKNSSF